MSVQDSIELDVTALVELPASDAFAVFAAERKLGQPHPIDPILKRVRSEIDGFHGDMSSATGRKRIAAMAYRVAQAKSALKKVGDELAAEAKSIPKRIDATRRHINDTLDAWRDEVRAPLDVWEAAETARKARHLAVLSKINGTYFQGDGCTSVEITQHLQWVQNLEINAANCEEYEGEYQIARDTAIQALHKMLQLTAKREAEANELAALRAAADARRRAEHEETLRAEGEERARLDAENDLRVERARLASEAARREAEHRAALEAAERRALEAAQTAKREMEAEATAKAAAQAKLAADKTHRAAINRAAMAAFVENGADETTAKFIISLIAKGKIPGIVIQY